MNKPYLILIFATTMLATAVMALEFNQNHRLLYVIILALIVGRAIYTKTIKKKDD